MASNGPTVIDNPALTCVSCSLRKHAKLAAVDPDTDSEVPIFNLRTERWADHFRWDGFRVIGLTPTLSATAASLGMNRPLILAIREEEAARGRHPPNEPPEMQTPASAG